MVMRTILILFAAAAAVHCGREGSPRATASQPIAISAAESPAVPDLRVQQVVVSPETVPQGQSARISLRLDRADPKAIVSVNWFAPSGWSVLEMKRPARSREITFAAPPKIFDEPGRYRAEVLTGSVYQGQAMLTVTGR